MNDQELYSRRRLLALTDQEAEEESIKVAYQRIRYLREIEAQKMIYRHRSMQIIQSQAIRYDGTKEA